MRKNGAAKTQPAESIFKRQRFDCQKRYFAKARVQKKNLFWAITGPVRARAGSPGWGRGDRKGGAGSPRCRVSGADFQFSWPKPKKPKLPPGNFSLASSSRPQKLLVNWENPRPGPIGATLEILIQGGTRITMTTVQWSS